MFKYRDLVGYVAFGLSLPLVAVKAVVVAVPSLIAAVASRLGYDRSASGCFTVAKRVSDAFNYVEKCWISVISVALYPKGMSLYRQNRPVVDLLNRYARTGSPKWGEIGTNLRNGGKKEGFVEVWLKLIAMFSVLPTVRHALLNNPFLFRYSFYLTNQSTSPFRNRETMCKIIFAYVNDPSFYPDECDGNKLHGVDEIGFTPNYYNDPDDRQLNYDNCGVQFGSKTATLIYLETIPKAPHQLLNMINKGEGYDSPKSIMNRDHPLHRAIHDVGLDLVNQVEFSEAMRHPILDLVIPYNSYYHIVTGLVEANVRNGEVIEHPMLCLTSDGQFMRKMWCMVEALFNNNVMPYLNSIE